MMTCNILDSSISEWFLLFHKLNTVNFVIYNILNWINGAWAGNSDLIWETTDLEQALSALIKHIFTSTYFIK